MWSNLEIKAERGEPLGLEKYVCEARLPEPLPHSIHNSSVLYTPSIHEIVKKISLSASHTRSVHHMSASLPRAHNVHMERIVYIPSIHYTRPDKLRSENG